MKEKHHRNHDCEGCRIANWLIRDKYGGEEVVSRVTRSDFARRQFLKNIEADFDRLEAGEPIDYVIGWREFLGCKIDLSSRPLIPREETEFWVGEVLRDRFSCTCPSKPWRSGDEMGSRKTEATCEVAFSSTKNDFSRPLRVLDLFSGSGCIGLAVLKNIPNAKVTFGEKDPKLCECCAASPFPLPPGSSGPSGHGLSRPS